MPLGLEEDSLMILQLMLSFAWKDCWNNIVGLTPQAMATLETQANYTLLQRLTDLRHRSVNHTWLWHLDARKGSVLSLADCVLVVGSASFRS
eukprot:5468539-Amphidinium_carterae.1